MIIESSHYYACTNNLRFQLTNASDLLKAKNWQDLPKRYSVLN